MAEKTKAKPDAAELEAAIDSLLREIDVTCTRFENPEPVVGDETPDEAVPDAAADAAGAIEGAGQSAEALLGQAADDLINSLEAEVEGAASVVKKAKAKTGANDAMLSEALDALIAETTEPVAGAPAAADAPKTGATEIDDLLDGSFESADGAAVDTAGVDTAPVRSLMLDEVVAGPAPVGAAPAPAVAAVTRPVATDSRATEGAGVAGGKREAASAAARSGARKTATAVTKVRVWMTPRLVTLGIAGLRMAKPIGARALMLLSKPLEGRSPAVRDSVGWVAVWTLFLALCVWATLALRDPQTPAAETPGTRVLTQADAG